MLVCGLGLGVVRDRQLLHDADQETTTQSGNTTVYLLMTIVLMSKPLLWRCWLCVGAGLVPPPASGPRETLGLPRGAQPREG